MGRGPQNGRKAAEGAAKGTGKGEEKEEKQKEKRGRERLRKHQGRRRENGLTRRSPLRQKYAGLKRRLLCGPPGGAGYDRGRGLSPQKRRKFAHHPTEKPGGPSYNGKYRLYRTI